MKFLACFFGVFYFSLEIISTSHSAINPFSLPDSRFLSLLIISIIKIKGLDLSVVAEQSVFLEGEEVGVDGREADSEGRKLSTKIIASHMQPVNYLKFKKKTTFSVIFQDKKIKHCLFSLSYEYLFTAHIRKGDTLFSFSHFTEI